MYIINHHSHTISHIFLCLLFSVQYVYLNSLYLDNCTVHYISHTGYNPILYSRERGVSLHVAAKFTDPEASPV